MSKPLAGVRLLVTHADAADTEALIAVLHRAGARVASARSAQEAVDAFQADPPNAIISDLDATEARDYKLIRRLRTLKNGRDVPAIAVSALPWEEHRAKALDAGYSQWLAHPAEEPIVEVVGGLLRRQAEPVARPLPAAGSGRSLLTDISATPMTEIIRHLWRARRSGDLLVRARKTVKMIFFDRGRIVFAASNVKKERLGEVLMALGTISGDEFHLASRVMAERKVRFGDALVAAGVMEKGAVTSSVVKWVERIVLSLFDVSVGTVSFDDRLCPIPPEYRVDLPTPRILYLGARSMTDMDRVTAALGNLDRSLTFLGEPDFAVEPDDIDVLEMAKTPASIRRLAWGGKALDPNRLRAVYGLMSAGVLRNPAEAVEPPPPPPPPKAPKVDALAAVRREVHDEMARSEALDYVAWLAVAANAAPAEIVSALEERQARYEALLSAVANDTELKTDVELLRGRVSMALRLARRPPERSVAAPSPEPLPETAPPPPAPAEPSAPGPAPSSNSGMATEHLLMEASIKLSVGDFADAARVYARIVEMQPDVAEYRARLAICLARSSRTAREAEAEFQEAIRLEPNNAELHYQLALYYKAMKVRSRSIAELRTTLQLNPRHAKARAELEATSPRDSALEGLKKLLR